MDSTVTAEYSEIADTEPQQSQALTRLNDQTTALDGIHPDNLRRLMEMEQERRSIIRTYIARNLKPGTDYGSIAVGGRESKPSLFKPGAEKVCSLLNLRAELEADHEALAMAGNITGLFAYRCKLISRATGEIVGEGRGAADLSEKRGWTVNNALKICEKRAQVDAVLRVVGLSEIFTQDIEDAEQRAASDYDAQQRQQNRPPAQAQPPAPHQNAQNGPQRPAQTPAPEQPAQASTATTPAPQPSPRRAELNRMYAHFLKFGVLDADANTLLKLENKSGQEIKAMAVEDLRTLVDQVIATYPNYDRAMKGLETEQRQTRATLSK